MTKLILAVTCMVGILFATPLWEADAPPTTASKEGETETESLTELNKQLTSLIKGTLF